MERHRLDITSLLVGLAAVALGVTELAGDAGSIDWALVAPIVALILGAAVMLGVRRGGDR